MTVRCSVVVAVLIAAGLVGSAAAVAEPPPTVNGTTDGNLWRVSANVGPAGEHGRPPGSAGRTLDCLRPGTVIIAIGDPCGIVTPACTKAVAANAASGKLAFTTTVTQVAAADGSTQTVGVNCLAGPPVRGNPNVLLAIHDEFAKLVPVVAIRFAGQSGVSLIGVETLYWLDTPTTVDLGTTLLLGQPVQFMAEVQSVHWDFGDGQSAAYAGAGKPFGADDHCATPTCPGWFGHVYSDPAAGLTITATATWTGRYSINGGPFIAIDGTAAAGAVTVSMSVVESRSVLVAGVPR